MRYPYYMGVPWLNNNRRPQQTKRIPSVLTKDEVAGLFEQMDCINALLVRLLHGTGIRLMEGMRLRVKDVDFERHAVVVSEAKGNINRMVMLPLSLALALRVPMRATHAEATDQPLTFSPNYATHAAPQIPAPGRAPGC
jgi:integrase